MAASLFIVYIFNVSQKTGHPTRVDNFAKY